MFSKPIKLRAGDWDFGHHSFASFYGCFNSLKTSQKGGVIFLTSLCATNVQTQKRQLH